MQGARPSQLRASRMGYLMALELMHARTVMPKSKPVSALAPVLSQLSDKANLKHFYCVMPRNANQNVRTGVNGTLLTLTTSIKFLKLINYPPVPINDDKLSM